MNQFSLCICFVNPSVKHLFHFTKSLN